MSMLSLSQQRHRLRRELSRRIGYTNGLHDIFRFGRVVSYLHKIAPASNVSLRAIIMEEEKVHGTKYADGVLEVAGALGLIDRVGTKLMPSDKGYALHAVQQIDNSNEMKKALLLNAVLEADGDATLNLLDILSGDASSEDVGHMLMERLLQILEWRTRWAKENVESRLARDIVLQEISESRERLESAVDVGRKQVRTWSSYREHPRLSAEKRVAMFYNHTVQPRRGWLRDLGCIEQRDNRQYHITESGHRLLASFKGAYCYSESVIVLPLSTDMMEQLGVAGSEEREGMFWRSIAQAFREPTSSARFSSTEYLSIVEAIYPYVKLHVFNEATIESIYNVISAQLAIEGRYIDKPVFEEQLSHVGRDHPDRIFGLRQRQGRSGYIAMRGYS